MGKSTKIMNAGEHIQGRYRLEQELGKGGMATVWRAHDLRLERPVAMKFLMPPMAEDPEFLVRFFTEAQQVARLSHPNVVRVLDFGEGDDCPYLVMEYLSGGSLQDLTGAPMEPSRAISLISAAALGAGAAHEAGMVHRDLKPGNIMLGEEGTPKVGDFGIAVTKANERLTATGTAIGSPHYVSPEQASGRPIGPGSDVYSLGVVLYELLTGKRPFERDNAMQLAIAHVEETPEPPSAVEPTLSPAIDEVVMRCLAKDPEARFSNGAEMATALGRLDATGTAPFAVAVSAAPATASETRAATAAVHEVEDETPVARNARRIASVAALAALFLGLLVFGVMALGNDGGRGEDKAAAEVDQEGSVNAEESPTKRNKTDGYEEDVYAATTSSGSAPSPTPTAAEEEQEQEKEAARQSGSGSSSGGSGSTTGEEPAEDPTPEPTSEPTSEPSPAPTSSP